MHTQSRGVLCGTVVTHGVAGGSANPAYWLALLSTYMAYEMGELAAQFGVLKIIPISVSCGGHASTSYPTRSPAFLNVIIDWL